jgi:glycerate kinase
VEFVIAPDKFKGTLGASEAADAIGRGVRKVFPAAALALRPLADGGEGTVEALLTGLGGRASYEKVTGPLGDEAEAAIGWLADGRAAIEVAQASGLVLVPQGRRDALRAHSVGVGELIRAVAESGRTRSLVVGIGGSAMTDGGTGAARALGWRFLDAAGRDLPLGGEALIDLARIDGSAVADAVRDLEIVLASDVDNPLLGDEGAARVFAPQKGASADQVELLERALTVLARRIKEDVGVDVAGRPGAGAAGGLGAGLMAFCGASLRPGFDLVAEVTGLNEAIRAVDYVITGEGKLDRQSLGGKAPIGVARLAAKSLVVCFAVAGDIPLNDRKKLGEAGFAGMASVVETVGEQRAFEDPSNAIQATTEKLLRSKILREVPGRRDRRIV